MNDFDAAVSRLLDSSHEGGFSKDPHDPGNWTGGAVGVGNLVGTRYGISAASYPNVDLLTLTKEKARTIYWADFWERLGLSNIAKPANGLIFDAAVNHGPGNAARLMQRALGVLPDGKIGPITRAAMANADQANFTMRFIAYRLLFWTDTSIWSSQGKGWTRRGAMELLSASDTISGK